MEMLLDFPFARCPPQKGPFNSRWLLALPVLLGLTSCRDKSRAAAQGSTPAEVGTQGCIAPEGMGSPSSIQEAVDLINVLPSPVTIPCLVQSLDRPLAINSTMSFVSAQPAVDEHSPRVFIFLDSLSLSIVPAGWASDLLELGEYSGIHESLKGEIQMPVEPPITQDAAYDHLRYNQAVTVCGLCHLDERKATEIDHPNAFISQSFQPPEDELVPLADVRAEHESCDPQQEPDRCAIFSALFDHGRVEHQDFPDEMSTIYGD